ncbi:MAG: hypothetical protein U0841_24250 [Chloroflexia bacterium]
MLHAEIGDQHGDEEGDGVEPGGATPGDGRAGPESDADGQRDDAQRLIGDGDDGAERGEEVAAEVPGPAVGGANRAERRAEQDVERREEGQREAVIGDGRGGATSG